METIGDILGRLNATVVRRREELTKERLMEEAQGMAALGYDFDERSLKLLRTYLTTGTGLLVMGTVGTGKTFFFKARKMPILSMQQVCTHTLAEVTSALESHHDEEMLVDDIGSEGVFNNYGTKVDILSVIVEDRLQTEARTHFTTNLTLGELVGKYGARTFDRIKELSRLVEWNGASKRRADGARIETVDFYIPRLWKECAERCSFYDETSHICTKKVRREPRSVERCPWF